MRIASNLEENAAEPGIFTWSLAEDTVYGDTAIASLFGLDPAETICGLPIASYIERIHTDDRARVAALISQAVRGGMPYHAEYRVLDAFDEIRWVMAMGRCFRNRQGDPNHYAGIVYPLELL